MASEHVAGAARGLDLDGGVPVFGSGGQGVGGLESVEGQLVQAERLAGGGLTKEGANFAGGVPGSGEGLSGFLPASDGVLELPASRRFVTGGHFHGGKIVVTGEARRDQAKENQSDANDPKKARANLLCGTHIERGGWQATWKNARNLIGGEEGGI